MDLLSEHWSIVICRWTARTIGIPLFGLIVVLTLGERVPNLLTASPQEYMLGAVLLTMLFGPVQYPRL